MAKTNNIMTENGEIQLPAWASEATMQRIGNITHGTNVLSKKLLQNAKKDANISKETLDAVSTAINAVQTNAETNQQQSSNAANNIAKGANKINKVADFFGNSETPLTSLVDAAGTLVDKMKGANGKGGLAALTDKLPGLKGFFDKFGGGMQVATDAALAYAGWNAAKYEQFAKVQRTMIDSGAIFYETGEVFDQLYTDTFQAGVTYDKFSETVANFGGTMTALGGDVSGGAVRLVSMFKSMSTATDSLGDLGMLNNELLQTYAQYMETQRLTGALDRKLANNGEELEKSFVNLVVESTAMASLTALNRGEALQAAMSAMSNEFLAAGTQTLRDQGLDKTATNAEALMIQLAQIKDTGPASGLMQSLEDAFNRNLLEFSGDISKFQVETGMAPEQRAAFDRAMPGFLERINDMVRNGEASEEVARNFMVQEFAKMDMTKIATAGAQDGSPLKLIQELQATGILINKNFGNWIDATDAEIDGYLQDTKDKLNESGKTTVAMNDMAKMFLTAQEFITLPMQTFGSALETMTNWAEETTSSLNSGQASLFEHILGGNSTELQENNSNEIIPDNNDSSSNVPNNNQVSDASSTISSTDATVNNDNTVQLASLDLTDDGNDSTIHKNTWLNLTNDAIKRANTEKNLLEGNIVLAEARVKDAEDKTFNQLRAERMQYSA